MKLIVSATTLTPGIVQSLIQIPRQSDPPIHLPQQQAARITGDVAALEVDLKFS
jgi:hypothetical protein